MTSLDLPIISAATLLHELTELRAAVQHEGETLYQTWVAQLARPEFAPSAHNLACYLAFRKHDLMPLQLHLMTWGLSSFQHNQSRVLASLDTVLATLHSIVQQQPRPHPIPSEFFHGYQLLEANARTVLGPEPPDRRVRIMVTLPTDAATNYDLVLGMLERGMNCARINCAHDSPDVWAQMLANLRRACAQLGRTCKLFMDLGGPKVRTGEISFGERRRLFPGDTVLLARTAPMANPAYPFQVSCTLPAVLDQVQVGQSVWFDDGKIGAVVQQIVPEGLLLLIVSARPEGARLRPEKGINFPDTMLNVTPLTEKDLLDLDFVVQHADMVGYSFVQSAHDIALLQAAIQQRLADLPPRAPLAIVAKIETRSAITNIPEMIVQAAGQQPFAVMIARGDLAVEVGFEHLHEMQEQILSICEAAHIPVIMATQVLENLAKRGTPSRAEVTDAAFAQRAECVMLNKGSFMLQTVSVLSRMLAALEAHQYKTLAGLRAARIWRDLGPLEPHDPA